MATRPLPPSTARTISTSDTGATLTSVADDVVTGEAIILERDGTPAAAVISMDDYRALQAMREKDRRAEALRRLEAIAAESRIRNADLSEDDVEVIAQQISRELREERYPESQRRQSDTDGTGNCSR